MGTLFRSEKMNKIQVILPLEAAHNTVDELGELGLVQFIDLNAGVNAFARNFVNEVRRADDCERRLRVIHKALDDDCAEHGVERVDLRAGVLALDNERSVSFDAVETELAQMEADLTSFKKNMLGLTRSLADAVEFSHVLEKDTQFFADAAGGGPGADDAAAEAAPLLGARSSGVGFTTGVIPESKAAALERVLWRATRGNLLMRRAEIAEPLFDVSENAKVRKTVFIVFHQGERAALKVRRLCETSGARLHQCPATAPERRRALTANETAIKENREVLDRTSDMGRALLNQAGLRLDLWEKIVRKQKAIYTTLNMFDYDLGRKTLVAEGWVPSSELPAVQAALMRAAQRSGSDTAPIVNTVDFGREMPPTYFKTNKFTQPFHGIVESYGVPTYGEVCATPFVVTTFPFLFAVMFGDFGHGLLLLLFALALIVYEKRLGAMGNRLNEMVRMVYDGRYLLLLMGLFSLYCGAIYNEFFSVPFTPFRSQWAFHKNSSNTGESAYRAYNGTYWFGVDRAWGGVPNTLDFYNSLKMKTSVIFGVTQMVFGIFLSLINAIHFRRPLNIFFEFIPQMALMLSLFGYLSVLVIIKWLTNYRSSCPDAHFNNVTGECSITYVGNVPFLINPMINMFLKPTSLADPAIFPGQLYVQWALLGIALISVPTMLLVKPIILHIKHRVLLRRRARHGPLGAAGGVYEPISDAHDSHSLVDDDHHHEHEHEHDHDHRDHHGATAKGSKGKEPLEGASSSGKGRSSKAKESSKPGDEHDHHEGGGHGDGGPEPEPGEPGFDVSETYVHQLIHSIEFVLGTISNTASYLRLWALSLAHSELSIVFWDRVFVQTMSLASNVYYGWAAMFVGFGAWAGLTVGVLLMMESLSAFLHALRLHWVEFQNKFYQGNGKAFKPFSFELIAQEEQANS